MWALLTPGSCLWTSPATYLTFPYQKLPNFLRHINVDMCVSLLCNKQLRKLHPAISTNWGNYWKKLNWAFPSNTVVIFPDDKQTYCIMTWLFLQPQHRMMDLEQPKWYFGDTLVQASCFTGERHKGERLISMPGLQWVSAGASRLSTGLSGSREALPPISHWPCAAPSDPGSRGEDPIAEATLVTVLLPQLHVGPHRMLALLSHHHLHERGTGQVHQLLSPREGYPHWTKPGLVEYLRRGFNEAELLRSAWACTSG